MGSSAIDDAEEHGEGHADDSGHHDDRGEEVRGLAEKNGEDGCGAALPSRRICLHQPAPNCPNEGSEE